MRKSKKGNQGITIDYYDKVIGSAEECFFWKAIDDYTPQAGNKRDILSKQRQLRHICVVLQNVTTHCTVVQRRPRRGTC